MASDLIFLAATIVGGIFGLIGLQLMQQNWFKREDLKYKFDVKRAKLRAKKIPVKATSTPSSPLDWLQTIKQLDPEMVHNLVDTISGSGNEIEQDPGGGGIGAGLMKFAESNPEMVQNFLAGLQKQQGEQQGNETVR